MDKQVFMTFVLLFILLTPALFCNGDSCTGVVVFLVFLSRGHPQKVAFGKNNPRQFQGNLGW